MKTNIDKGYNNLFIAIKDIKYTSDKHIVLVRKGTILFAAGGGYFYNINGDIQIGRVTRINGKSIDYYNIRTDKENYIEIKDTIWISTINLVKELENWASNYSYIQELAYSDHILYLENIKMIIKSRLDTITKIQHLLK